MAGGAQLLQVLWGQRVGSGVIDCDYDSEHDTVVVGDLSGQVVLLDSTAAELERYALGMPVWGVAHGYTSTGQLMIAAALADKQNNRGAFVLLLDGETLAKHEFNTPCWDTVFFADGVAWTLWDGRFGWVPLDGSAEPHFVSLGGALYGATDLGDRAAVVASGRGLFEVTLDRSAEKLDHRRIHRDTSVCYNLAYRSSDGVLFAGSTSERIVSFPSREHRLDVGKGAICGIATADDLVIAGTLDGSLQLFAPGGTGRPLAATTLPGGIWNVSLDADRGIGFVACGDGALYRIAIEHGTLASDDARLVERRVRQLTDGASIDRLSNPVEIALAASILEDQWEVLSETELRIARRLLTEWQRTLDDDRVNYLLGLANLSLDSLDDSVVHLQAIPQSSRYFVASLEPLSLAFERLGLPSSAIRILQTNLESLHDGELPGTLFRIGHLQEERGDLEKAVEAYEAVSFLDHAFPGVQAALDRLKSSGARPQSQPMPRLDDRHQVMAGPEALEPLDFVKDTGLGKRRQGEYDILSYMRYEAAGPADEAKKILEAGLMEGVVSQVEARAPLRTALDIGCASGRWPVWFARRRYDAHGYDISEHSIAICERRAEQVPDLSLTFRNHNISEGALDRDCFAVVTCMMGTFNHVPFDERPRFLNGIAASLSTHGLFVFTIWNAASPYCQFLALDSQRAKDDLRRNAVGRADLQTALDDAGLRLMSFVPFCFLPNECYDVWEDDLANVELIARIDEFFRGVLADGRPQMYFCIAERADREQP